MDERICEVGWDEIKVSPFQPRRHIGEEEIGELAASIRSVGLIHPPVVREIKQEGKLLYYELIAGERRWRAAERAGLTRLVVIVRTSTDNDAVRAALIENVQRVDLNPLELAEAFRRLVEVFQMTQEEVAEKVGKKRSTIANYLRLLSLPDTIRTSLLEGKITMGHAKAILSQDTFALQEKLHKLILSKQLTVRSAEHASTHLTQKSPKDIHTRDLEERLQKHFGTQVALTPTGKGGRLTLHYYSLDDLDRLLALLGVSPI